MGRADRRPERCRWLIGNVVGKGRLLGRVLVRCVRRRFGFRVCSALFCPASSSVCAGCSVLAWSVSGSRSSSVFESVLMGDTRGDRSEPRTTEFGISLAGPSFS